MAPIVLGLLVLAFIAFVWLGRTGAQGAKTALRRNGARLGGILLLGLAVLMTVRGLWEPALVPAALGWWLISGGAMTGTIGAALKLYLDRRFPGWRQHVHPDADTGPRSANRSRVSGVMTEEEAYEILGLQAGCPRDAIGAAYRAAMKKVHPDQGGSAEMAVRLNLARDLLLRRHA